MADRLPDAAPAADPTDGSSTDASDPYRREHQTFPTFDEEQIRRTKEGEQETRDVGGTRPSSPFTTSVEGVYAVGDVRSGSVRRVASGVGEGSVRIQSVHRRLAEHGDEESDG